ncbi:hypothetical protein B0T17DRAFT_545907 [Bombardia bombarda]|uniref:Uncharacterized protein n=1 Tax=Bombardia bombarda TaxID=252184 RepID=A0AA39U3A9_9PEZI|nr:hypothetical protein B0T17DRAFT_545907 [Bombardia bombarda]
MTNGLTASVGLQIPDLVLELVKREIANISSGSSCRLVLLIGRCQMWFWWTGRLQRFC